VFMRTYKKEMSEKAERLAKKPKDASEDPRQK
jgi:hypothetical protein